jgi:nucleoid-associated protein YgaU
MFNNKDEYAAATEKASINQHGKGNIGGYKLGIFNLFLLTTIGVMGYVSFDSFKNDESIKVEKINSTSDSELLDILSIVDINSVEEKKDLESLSSAINNVVSDSTLSDDSLYTQALSRELNKDGVRTIVVQKGDTLASLSLKYYGNALAYDKIISNNRTLSSKSHTIFPGQELNLPY